MNFLEDEFGLNDSDEAAQIISDANNTLQLMQKTLSGLQNTLSQKV